MKDAAVLSTIFDDDEDDEEREGENILSLHPGVMATCLVEGLGCNTPSIWQS